MQKNSIITILAVVAILGAATGCNKKVQTAQLRQSYDVKYSMDSGAFSVFATLSYSDGGKMIFPDRSILTANGLVDSNGVSNDPGGFSWETNNAQDITFLLKKNDEITIVNKVLRSDINDIDFAIDSVLHIGDTMRATILGAPLQGNESIYMGMNRIYDSTELQSSASAESDGQRFTFDFNETKALYPGKYYVGITRKKTLPLQQSDAGGGGSITISLYKYRNVVVK
jgi:hypothetical protein